MNDHGNRVVGLFRNGDMQFTVCKLHNINNMQRLTTTHVRRWHLHRRTVGCGHLYQGTYKSFPIEADEHLLTALCYVERNALRAGLVSRAEQGRWGSLWRRCGGECEHAVTLAAWPLPRWAGWVEHVNGPQTEAELAAVRRSVQRSSPFGEAPWSEEMVRRLGLESPLRPQGCPKKHKNGS